MPIAVAGTGHLLTRTADGSSGEVSLPKNSTKLLRKFKENYYQITANQNLYILQQRLCCHHYFEHWFYVTWQRYEETKEKEKEKKKDIRSNFANADMNQQGRRKRVGRGLWIRPSPTSRNFFYCLVKEKWSKFPISQLIMCYLSIDIIFKGMVLGGAWCAHLCSKGFRRSWKSSCHSLLCSHRLTPKKDELTLFPLGKDTFYHRDSIYQRPDQYKNTSIQYPVWFSNTEVSVFNLKNTE